MQFLAFINLTSADGHRIRLNVASIAAYQVRGGSTCVDQMGLMSPLQVLESPEEIDQKILNACGQAVVFA